MAEEEEEEVEKGACISTWQKATDSILLDVFSFLDATSLCHAAQTCKTWNRVALDKTLWRNLLRCSINDPECALPVGRLSWLKEYERIHFRAPLVLSETLTQHIDEVLHVSFAHGGHLFSTTSKDCALKVWEVGYPTQLKFMKDFTDLQWSDTHFSCFNESDTMILVSGDNVEITDGSGFVAVLSLIHDFKILKIIAVNSSQWFRSWLDDNTLLGEHLKKSEDGRTTKVEVEAYKVLDTFSADSEPFIGDYLDNNTRFGNVLLTVSCGAASLIKFMKVANVPRSFVDTVPASICECSRLADTIPASICECSRLADTIPTSICECSQFADTIPASICECSQLITALDDNDSEKSTFSYSSVIDNTRQSDMCDQAKHCSNGEIKDISKGFFVEKIVTDLGQDAKDKSSEFHDSDNDVKLDVCNNSMETCLETDYNPSDCEIKSGLTNETNARDADDDTVQQVNMITDEAIGFVISDSENRHGKTKLFSLVGENSILSTNLEHFTSVENVMHSRDACSNGYYTSNCTVHPNNTSNCTVHPNNTSNCTVHPNNTSNCTVYPNNTSNCTVYPNNTSNCTAHIDNTSNCTAHLNNTSNCTVHPNNTSNCTVHPNNTSNCPVHPKNCTVHPMQHDLEGVKHSSKTTPTCNRSEGFDKILIFVTGEFSGSLNRLCFKSLSNVIPNATSTKESAGQDIECNEERDTDSKLDHIIDLDGRVVGVCLSEDQRYIFINFRPWMDKVDRAEPRERPHLSPNVEIRVIDLLTFQEKSVKYVGHKGYFPSFMCCLVYLDVSQDYIASGSTNTEGYLWDRHYKCILGNFEHGPGVVNAVAFCPSNQECAVTVSDDNTIKVWRSKRLMKSLCKTQEYTHL
ncbi:hypothetical protein ACJMK2_042951 [Sinanodonta woodiana]|uniref:F-box domain-containing protein n=1 Tax=Sinanodonta woodiana TaxID=1069815 RepID=A0ABD3VVX9_SINWO